MAEEKKKKNVSNHTRKRTKNGQVRGKNSVSKKKVAPKKEVVKKEVSKKENVKVEIKKEIPKVEEVKKSKEVVEPVFLEDTRKNDIEMPFINKPKKKGKALKVISIILFVLVLLVILYAYGEPFDVSSDTDISSRVNDKVDVLFKLSGNKPILKTYYAIDPEDENDKSLYKEIKGNGILFNKDIKIEGLEVTSGKKRVCIYVESLLFTRDVECQLIVSK